VATAVYRPRDPRQSIVRGVLLEHLAAFRAEVEAAERPMPAFVERSLGALVFCGDPSCGVAHVHCDACGLNGAVPFTCGTDLCCSCASRRMVETAAHLVDRVLPCQPVRQWVLTFPPPLRYLLAYDHELCSLVVNIFVGRVFAWLRRTAKRELGLVRLSQAHPGAVTVLQRAGDGLRLNLHVHAVALDGCYIEKSRGDELAFWAAPPPTRTDVAQVAWEVCERVTRLLQKRGRYFDTDPSEDPLATDQPLLAACYAASLQGVVTLGERAGKPLARGGRTPAGPELTAGAKGANEADAASLTPGHGFNLHAGVRVSAQDRRGLTRLCKYVARGPFANDRLSLTPDGQVAFRLRRTWRDGTTRLVFTPHDFISKLLPLIWAPYRNRIRYHGLFASNARLRSRVVPTPPPETDHRPPKQLPLRPPKGAKTKPRAEPHRYTWAQLLCRSFEHQGRCPRCGRGKLRVIATITHTCAIVALLDAVDLPWQVPSAHSPRGPPTAPTTRNAQLDLPFRGDNPTATLEPGEAA
jgi:hypothetical protein